VILAIADSKAKKPYFSLDERIAMAREVLADVKNLQVTGFSGLLTDFVRKQGARVVLRGLRAVSDFEYEFQLAGMNRNLYPEMGDHLPHAVRAAHVHLATLVREIASLGGDVSEFVHPLVAKRLKQKAKN